MADCEWAIICDYAFSDAQGKMCLIGIFDGIYAPSVPAIHGQIVLAIQLRGKPKEPVHVVIEIVRPTGSSLRRVEARGEMSDSGGAGLQINLGPLNLPDWGRYQCRIAVNDEPAYSTGFDLRKPPSRGVN